MSSPSILYAALHEKVGAEVLNEAQKGKQLNFSLRIKKGASTTLWLAVVERLLTLANEELTKADPSWTLDISKQYFMKPDLKFSWRVILKSDAMPELCDALAKEVLAAKLQQQVTEVQEVNLHGSPNRRSGGYTGTVPVGPLAR
jgi:hypothetical protein